MAKSKVDKVLIFLYVLVAIGAINLVLMIYFTELHCRLEYKEYEGPRIVQTAYSGNIPTKEEIINDINERTGTCYKVEYVKGMNGGQTRLISNVIEIDPSLAREAFVWVYIHEIFHHTFFTHNDLFIEFETFKYLYESDNPFYSHSAIYCLMQMGPHNKQYDASYYIYDYLKNKGEI